MEAVVLCCIGTFAALGVGLLLAGESAPGRGAVRSVAHSPVESLGLAVASAARAVGALIAPAGAVSAPWAASMAEELGRVALPGGVRPVSDASSACGLLALMMGASALLGLALSGSAPGLLIGAALPAIVLAVRVAARARERARDLEAAMPEAFGALAIALGSGHSLSQAMRYVGSHAAEPVRSEFMRVSFSIDCGIPAGEALDALLARLPAPGLDMVALALKVSQRTGAPLRDLLAEAAQLVGTRIELKRHLDVKTSQARMSARLVAGMPLAMVCLLSALSADFRAGLVTVKGGGAVVAALVLNAVAWSIIRKIMEVRL